jgi:hypothetical protein
MPYVVRKVRNKSCYQVKNPVTGKIHANCTTKAKAEAQVRVIEQRVKGK